jgi:transcriptional regulator with XRE-family HTH domain
MSATLGGLIKDLRLQKNISQLEIAFALGWKETSRLSRIEQGRNSSPPRFLIEKIMDAMKLTEEERNQLYVVGNFLPTAEDIKQAREKLKPIIDDWEYPAVCLDYSWRIIYANRQLNDLFGITTSQATYIENNNPWIIEVIFNPDFPLNKTDNEQEETARRDFLKTAVTLFQYSQRGRTKEHWYQELIKRLMATDLFREMWVESQNRTNAIHSNSSFIAKNIIKRNKDGTKNKYSFYYFIEPVYKDQRFLIDYHIPSDLETFKLFKHTNI